MITLNFYSLPLARLTMLFSFMAVITITHSQIEWNWAVSANGEGLVGSSGILGIALDDENNSYVTGRIGPGAVIGSQTIEGHGWSDLLIAKYDPSGAPIWVVTGGGLYNDYGMSIVLASDGYLYVAGFGNGVIEIGGVEYGDEEYGFFLIKLNTDGDIIWTRYDGHTKIWYAENEPTIDMSADSDGHIYLGGTTLNNDHLLDTVYECALSESGVFLTQLDTSGHMNWTHFVDGTYGMAGNTNIAINVDPYDNLTFAASLMRVDTIINGPNSVTPFHNLVLGKLNPTGNSVWEVEYGDTENYVWDCQPQTLDTDYDGNIYISAYFNKNLLLSPTENGSFGGFMCKFNGADGSVMHCRYYNPENNTAVITGGMDYDHDAHVINSGSFCSSIDFGGIMLEPISTDYDCDLYIARYDTTLALDWVIRYGYENYDRLSATASNDEMYAVGGWFYDSLSFGDQHLYGNVTDNLLSLYLAVSINDVIQTGINQPSNESSISVYPNPTSSFITIKWPEPNTFPVTIYNEKGQMVLDTNASNGQSLDVSHFAAGIYYIKIKGKDLVLLHRLVVE